MWEGGGQAFRGLLAGGRETPHQPLINLNMFAEVPLAGLSLLGKRLYSSRDTDSDVKRRMTVVCVLVPLADMSNQSDLFRDFGVYRDAISPPPNEVRASLSLAQRIGQWFCVALIAALGIFTGVGCALLFGLTLLLPVGVPLAAAILACFGFLIHRLTRYDCAWVELSGETLRAKHLYSGRVNEYTIEDIKELFTIVSPVVNTAVLITEAWLGRIRGVLIRFRDGSTPFQVCRADPAMTNAKELIEAIVYRMAEKAAITAEIVNLEGKPLVRRIYWKSADTTAE